MGVWCILFYSHICTCPFNTVNCFTLKMIFVFHSLNFRYFNENLSGKKKKEPNSGGLAEEEKPAGRDKGRKEELRSKFMILSIQKCNVK